MALPSRSSVRVASHPPNARTVVTTVATSPRTLADRHRLLAQPCGFEGFAPVDEVILFDDLPLGNRVDEPVLGFDFGVASRRESSWDHGEFVAETPMRGGQS